MNVKTLNQPTLALPTGPEDGPQIDYVACVHFVSTGIAGHRVDVKYHTIPDVFQLPITERLRAINRSPVLLSFVTMLNSLNERLSGVPTMEQLEADRRAARGEPAAPKTASRLRLRHFDIHLHRARETQHHAPIKQQENRV